MPTPRQKLYCVGPGCPDVKFGQIAPYFGDQKLHVPAWCKPRL